MYLRRRHPALPLPSFEGLQEEVNRLFDSASGRGVANAGTRTWSPPVEIYDSGDELVVVAELPGFLKEEIDISFNDGQLTLSGERALPDDPTRNYHRNERWFGRFERAFQLPAAYDIDQIKAQLRDGVLKITLPKREESKARQISVSAG